MTKRKTKRLSQQLYHNLSQMMEAGQPEPELDDTIAAADFAGESIFRATLEEGQRLGEMPRMKKFRFQLLHRWLMQNYSPCRVADIGGGKGFLAYLLQLGGWEAVVIDPVYQTLPEKYKDLSLNQRIKIPPQASVPHISQGFETHLAKDFDLLVGMHAHACNVKIIDAAKEHGAGFVLLPCCIIDEPLTPLPGVHWLECLAEYAIQQGFSIRPFRLNFRGQNIGFHSVP
ncbi:MAG: hypothetical protein MUC85_06460 [Anaerolineales bacterium]|jgi:hypothetical protein|nr:hypothetical protein [Anaerolineales bacterium]